MVVATGVNYRRHPAPGVDDFTGLGVYYGSAMTEASQCADRDVYIVGGANSAGQAAVYLSRTARSVTILVRGESLAASMSHYLIRQIEQIPNITVRPGTEVIGAEGDGHLERILLRDNSSGAEEKAEAQWLFLFIGAAPQTDWLDGTVVRDDHGFVLAGPDLTIGGVRRPGGSSIAHRTTSKRVCRVCSWPGTCGRTRRNEWRPRSARGRWQ